MRVLYIRSEPAASVNSSFLWGRLSARKTKFNTSLPWRIHHHYDLITVAAEYVLSFPAIVCVCAGDGVLGAQITTAMPGESSSCAFLHTCTDTLTQILESCICMKLGIWLKNAITLKGIILRAWAHWVLTTSEDSRTYAHANTHAQITQIYAQSQSHTPTHTHSANPCWVCEDISFWVDNYEKIKRVKKKESEREREGKREKTKQMF